MHCLYFGPMRFQQKFGIQLDCKHKVAEEMQFSPQHYPVLINEVIEVLLPLQNRSKLRFFDGTFGRGGHTRAILKYFPQAEVIAFDQDLMALEFGRENFKTEVESKRLSLVHANFSQILDLNLGSFDMMLLDLGVSSPQLDAAERGFSFYHDGPLDMRMNQQQELTAEVVLNTFSEDQLNIVFKEYGEVHRPFRVTRAIVHDRKTKAFQTTKELAGLIERVDGWTKKGFHPATQYFMALRLVVNQELQSVETAVPQMISSLTPGGRLAVISFHSLEDRVVKNIFRDSELGGSVYKKVVTPQDEENQKNSRSRSAKLRVFERNGVQDELGKDQAF